MRNFMINHQLNIMFSLSVVCAIIVCFLIHTKYIYRRKKFRLILISLTGMLLLNADRLAYIYRGDVSEYGYWMVRVSNFLVFFCGLSISYQFGKFLAECIREKSDKVPKVFTFLKYFILSGEILLIVSQFTNSIYYFDNNNIYHRGELFLFYYSIPVITMLTQIVTVIIYKNKISKRLYISILLFTILPLVATFIQLFMYGISLVNIVISTAIIMLYISAIEDGNYVYVANEKIESELLIAKEIQENELPSSFPVSEDYELYADMVSAREVGGDFYDYYYIDDDHLAIAIADVSGKGVPAALNMVKTKLLLKEFGLRYKNPDEILRSVNDGFIDNNKLDIFITVWFGIVELSTGKLSFTNAGHESAIIYNEKSGFNQLQHKHDVPIGTVKKYKYHKYDVLLNKGDKLFLYTDGVIDSVNKRNKRYGANNLLKVLNAHCKKNSEELVNVVKSELDKYTGNCEQFDDLTMLCFEFNDKRSCSDSHIFLSKRIDADLSVIKDVFDYFASPIIDVVGESRAKKYYVVLDEILSNIINHGYENKSKDNYITIELDVDLEKRNIKVVFIDEGIPFNAVQASIPDISKSANDRKVGGLGLLIVKNMMDTVSYEFKDNKNYLTIEKKY